MSGRTIILLILLVGTSVGAIYYSKSSEPMSASTGSTEAPSVEPDTGEEFFASLERLGDPPTIKAGLTVSQAYRKIPHRQTAFNFDRAKLSEVDEVYLDVMFYLIDEGVRLRVHGVTKGPYKREDLRVVIDGYNEIYSYLDALKPPEHLKAYHQKIMTAFAHQKVFFSEALKRGSSFKWQGLGNHKAVRAASTALKRAYGILKRRYSSQNSKNLKAIFDYHCALDFI